MVVLECLIALYASGIFSFELPYVDSKGGFAITCILPLVFYGFYLDLLDYITRISVLSYVEIFLCRILPGITLIGIFIACFSTNYFIIKLLS